MVLAVLKSRYGRTQRNSRMRYTGFRKCGDWSEKVRCSSKVNPRLRAEWVVVREESCILESCLSPIRSSETVLSKLYYRPGI